MKIQKKIAMLTLGLLATTSFSAGVLQAAPAGNPPGSNTPAASFNSVSVTAATAIAGLFSGAFPGGSLLQALNTSATGGSTAVSGISSGGPGVAGTSSAAGWAGVQGAGGATGNGVYGSTSSPSVASYGVSGLASGGRGVFGTSTSNDGVYGISNSGVGVRAYSASSNAISANVSNGGGAAVFGYRNGSNGVGAIYGQMTAQSGAGSGYAVLGQYLDSGAAVGDQGTGVYGVANTGTGISARSVSGTGLRAQSDSTGNAIIAQNSSSSNATGTFTNSSSGSAVVATAAVGGSNPAGRFTKGSNSVDLGGSSLGLLVNGGAEITGNTKIRTGGWTGDAHILSTNGQDASGSMHTVLRSYNQSGAMQPLWIAGGLMTTDITTAGAAGSDLNIVTPGSTFFRSTAGGALDMAVNDTSISLNETITNSGTSNSGYVYVGDSFRTNGIADFQGSLSNSTGNLTLGDTVDVTGTLEAPTIRTATDGFRAYSTGNTHVGGNLYVTGTAYKPGGGSWAVSSDARLKDIKEQFNNGLKSILELNPIKYNYKKDNLLELPSDKTFTGLIAQEVQKVIPEAVETDEKGYLTINNDPIIWAMLNAIKELAGQDEVLKAKVTTLEAQNKALEARLSALEAKLK